MDIFIVLAVLNLIFFVSLIVFNNIFLSIFLTIIAACIFIYLQLYAHPQYDITLKNISLPEKLPKNNFYVYGIISLVMFIVLESFIGFGASLFASFILFCYLNKFDSRAAFVMSLFLFVLTVILTISLDLKSAEETATYLYFLLIGSLLWQIIELRKEEPYEKI